MKRLVLPLGALLLFLSFAPPAFADWETGVTLFPASNTSIAAVPGNSLDWMLGVHVGYTFRHWGYLTWDAISLPSYLTQRLSAGRYQVPSFLNLFDVGVHLGRNGLFGFAQAGLNTLWVYDTGFEPLVDTGANVRAGMGFRFGMWGVDLSATEVYPSFSALAQNLAGIVSRGTSGAAFQTFADNLIWSAGINIYFP